MLVRPRIVALITIGKRGIDVVFLPSASTQHLFLSVSWRLRSWLVRRS